MPKMRNSVKYLLSVFCFAVLSIEATAQSKSDKLLELIHIINMAYVDTINMDQLNEAAIVAMLAELDPHSVYIPKKEVQAMNESLAGSFEGIGVQFDVFKDTIVVISAITGGPSYKLGIQTGDKIISADNKLVSGVNISDEKVMSLLRGSRGSAVKVEIKRSNKPDLLSFEIVRDKIPINSVDASFMIDNDIGYIRINRFAKTTFDEFNDALDDLEDAGMQNLILDLRGNGGGYLYSAVELADEFLDGKDVIVSTKGLRQNDQVFSSRSKGRFTKGKLIVLVDEGTASASEILAGAIQDWDRGIVMGRRTFGKGLVMKPFTLSDGSMIRLTTSRYYTPSGRCIQKDYSDSKDVYEEEIHNRFEHGELFSLDSIEIPTELKFNTMSGRTVYGGGGILPDIFIPADTLIVGSRYQDVLKSGSIIEFSVEYFEKHKNDLNEKYQNALEFSINTEENDNLIEEYEEFLSRNDIKLKVGVENDMIPALSSQIKAFVARHIWGENAYYVVISSNQEILNQALEVMNSWENQWDLLSQRSK